jgi:Icc-related predicted phosphoesterase
MKIVLTADWHGTLPEIPQCDLLLIAGDVCPVSNHNRQFQAEWLRTEFADHLYEIDNRGTAIVWTGGNHDFVLADSEKIRKELPGTFLDNEARTVNGVKIWGSPLSPTFGNWAFMRDDRSLAAVWETIPSDTDILMTHGPMHGYGDIVESFAWSINGGEPKKEVFASEHVGSITLLNRLTYGDFPKLKLMVFGHIHEGYGKGVTERVTGETLRWVNASHMDGAYRPVNPPIEVTW